MDVDPLPLVILLAAICTAGFAIAAEAGMTTVSRSEIRTLSEEGDERAKSVQRLLHDPAQLLLTFLLLKTGGVLLAGAAMARLLPDTLPFSSLVIAVACAWVLLAILQAMGRRWVYERNLRVTMALLPTVRAAVVLLWPVTTLVRRLGDLVGDPGIDASVDNALMSDDGLLRLIGAAEDEDLIEESEKRMIASILEMNETVAREVMVPRIDLVALDVETTLPEAVAVIIEAGHSRIPVYEENIDQVVGFLYAKDALKVLANNQDELSIRSLLRPPYLVPVSKKVDSLLREMQQDRVHIAMVVDEYGGIAGLVTIEDILEEIVGEIQDEYDEEEEVFVQIEEPNRYVLNARLDVYTLAKLLGRELPEEDADTLGGLIYSELGHVPVVGEMVEVAGWRFTVLKLDGRRIDEVRAELVEADADEHLLADEATQEADDVKARQLHSSMWKLSPSE